MYCKICILLKFKLEQNNKNVAHISKPRFMIDGYFRILFTKEFKWDLDRICSVRN